MKESIAGLYRALAWVYCENDCGREIDEWELPSHGVLAVVGPIRLDLSLEDAGLVETALRRAIVGADAIEAALIARLIRALELALTAKL